MSLQINLFNSSLRKQKQYFSMLTMMQALGLVLLGSMVFYAYAQYQLPVLKRQLEESNKRYMAEQEKLARASAEFSPGQSQEALEAEFKKIEVQAVAQREMIDTLKSGAIGNTSGYSSYMRAFARQNVNGMWLTGFNITGDGVQMSISGSTLSPEFVPSYIKRLNRESVMRGKEFAALKMQQHAKEADQATTRNYIDFMLYSSDAGDKK